MTGSAAELGEQLVVEIMVRDLDRSIAVYSALGFTLERRDEGFAALRWEGRRVFLDQRSDLPPLSGPSRANVRILTGDVDSVWAVAQTLGLTVERPIADRYYGLRDFTVLDPDGFGLRFASPQNGRRVTLAKKTSSGVVQVFVQCHASARLARLRQLLGEGKMTWKRQRVSRKDRSRVESRKMGKRRREDAAPSNNRLKARR